MLVHAGRRDRSCSISSSRRRAPSGIERALGAGPDRGLTSRATRPRSSTSGPPPAGSPGRPRGLERARRALRHGAAGRARGARRPGWPATGSMVNAEQAYFFDDPGADPHPLRGGARALRAGRQPARRGRPVPLPGARRRARAARGRGRRAVLPRRDRGARCPTGCSSAAGPSARRPRRLRADCPRAGRGELPRAARCSRTRRPPRAGS